MLSRVRAAVFHGPQDVRIEQVPDPGRARAGEVVLEVLRAAICGTDSSEWDHGPVLCRPGVVLGHEFVGRVLAAGAGVEAFRPGDRVVSGAGISCGHCRWCLRRADQPVRGVPHARPAGRRRARGVRHVAGGHLPRRAGRRATTTPPRWRSPSPSACTRSRAPAWARTTPSRSSAAAASARSSSPAPRRAVDRAASSRSTSTPAAWRRPARSAPTRRSTRAAATWPS